MDNQEVINFHLTNSYIEIRPYTYFSGFCGALKDARKMTGRNINTGAKDGTNNFGHLGSWLGTVGYLILLDQVGNCFKLKNGPIIENSKSGIIKALKNFSILNDNQINVIYALRNSFTHDFSLQNVNKSKPELTHNFSVYHSENDALINLPSEQWGGELTSKSFQNNTKINLEELGDLVEKLVAGRFKYQMRHYHL